MTAAAMANLPVPVSFYVFFCCRDMIELCFRGRMPFLSNSLIASVSMSDVLLFDWFTRHLRLTCGRVEVRRSGAEEGGWEGRGGVPHANVYVCKRSGSLSDKGHVGHGNM